MKKHDIDDLAFTLDEQKAHEGIISSYFSLPDWNYTFQTIVNRALCEKNPKASMLLSMLREVMKHKSKEE